MLDEEKIEGLLSVPVKCNEGRLLRIMSCDNLIKEIFLFHQIPSNGDFDIRVKDSILILSEMMNYILQNEGNVDREKIKEISTEILPTNTIIENAKAEIREWYYLLEEILDKKSIVNMLSKIDELSMENYLILADFVGITNIDENIIRSRMLKRFTNFKRQTNHLLKGSILVDTFLEEAKNHKDYIKSMYNIYNDFSLENEDFPVFMLLFDIRKNRNLLK